MAPKNINAENRNKDSTNSKQKKRTICKEYITNNIVIPDEETNEEETANRNSLIDDLSDNEDFDETEEINLDEQDEDDETNYNNLTDSISNLIQKDNPNNENLKNYYLNYYKLAPAKTDNTIKRSVINELKELGFLMKDYVITENKEFKSKKTISINIFFNDYLKREKLFKLSMKGNTVSQYGEKHSISKRTKQKNINIQTSTKHIERTSK